MMKEKPIIRRKKLGPAPSPYPSEKIQSVQLLAADCAGLSAAELVALIVSKVPPGWEPIAPKVSQKLGIVVLRFREKSQDHKKLERRLAVIESQIGHIAEEMQNPAALRGGK